MFTGILSAKSAPRPWRYYENAARTRFLTPTDRAKTGAPKSSRDRLLVLLVVMACTALYDWSNGGITSSEVAVYVAGFALWSFICLKIEALANNWKVPKIDKTNDEMVAYGPDGVWWFSEFIPWAEFKDIRVTRGITDDAFLPEDLEEKLPEDEAEGRDLRERWWLCLYFDDHRLYRFASVRGPFLAADLAAFLNEEKKRYDAVEGALSDAA